MTISELLASSGCTLFAIATIIQIAPIRVNPWSALGRIIGRAINGELVKKIAALEGKIEKMEEKWDEDEIIRTRVRILRFGDECLHGITHSKEHFDQTLDDITNYNDYCSSHPLFKNDKTEITSGRIKEIYHDRLKNNDFM